jgi:hypothetical protein
MSFASILKKIFTSEHIVAVAAEELSPTYAPVIAVADDLFLRLQTAITIAEANNPVAGNGQIKEQAVINDFTTALGLTETALALQGKMVTYDEIALKNAISSQVAAYNAMATVKASFKIVEVPAKAS